jgi:hypothetical protein
MRCTEIREPSVARQAPANRTAGDRLKGCRAVIWGVGVPVGEAWGLRETRKPVPQV